MTTKTNNAQPKIRTVRDAITEAIVLEASKRLEMAPTWPDRPLDPRIGVLSREGVTRWYATINGEHRESCLLDVIEAALRDNDKATKTEYAFHLIDEYGDSQSVEHTKDYAEAKRWLVGEQQSQLPFDYHGNRIVACVIEKVEFKGNPSYRDEKVIETIGDMDALRTGGWIG